MDVLQRNHVVVEGRGERAIVFAPGFGCDQRVWRHLAPSFHSSHRVVLFDYVGAGRWDRTAYSAERYASLYDYARDVLEVAGALDLRGAVFVGHSVSGMIGALASIMEPHRFERLVMLAPSPRYLNDPPGYVGGFERHEIEALITLMDENFIGWARTLAQVATTSTEAETELTNSLCANDPVMLRRFAEVTFYCDHRKEMPDVPVPVLVIQCTDDDIAPVSVGKYLKTHLRKATYRLSGASGHMPHVTDPQEMRALIQDYLATPASSLP